MFHQRTRCSRQGVSRVGQKLAALETPRPGGESPEVTYFSFPSPSSQHSARHRLEDRPEKTHRGGPTTDEAASRGCFDVFVGASKPRPRASFRHGQRPRCSDSRCVSDDRISEPPFVLFTCSLCSKRETQERRGSSARARPPVVHSPVVLDSVRGETTKDCRKAKIN